MRVQHSTAFLISGIVWFAIGLFLLLMGVILIFFNSSTETLCDALSPCIGGLFIAKCLLFSSALIIGLLKGRLVLAKTVLKGTQRIIQMPNPIRLSQLYTIRYVFLIAFMISLGIILKRLPIMPDVRGGIDAAIGAALLLGAFLYFRISIAFRKQRPLDN